MSIAISARGRMIAAIHEPSSQPCREPIAVGCLSNLLLQAI
jgi:hypothetical protein